MNANRDLRADNGQSDVATWASAVNVFCEAMTPRRLAVLYAIGNGRASRPEITGALEQAPSRAGLEVALSSLYRAGLLIERRDDSGRAVFTLSDRGRMILDIVSQLSKERPQDLRGLRRVAKPGKGHDRPDVCLSAGQRATLKTVVKLVDSGSGSAPRKAILEKCGLSRHTVKTHLYTLRNAGLVEATYSGRETCYTITELGRAMSGL